MSEDTPVNTGVSWPPEYEAGLLVRRMQVKLHHWAAADRCRRFRDLFNLVSDPAFLTVAWQRVSTNAGARTPGVDRATVSYIVDRVGVHVFLNHIRGLLRSGQFRPVEVRQVMIPKASGKLRKLGIPTVTDRVVQAALKLVLEPIFEADCAPRGADLPGGVQDLTGLLSQQGLRSWGQPDPGGAGEGGSSPDNVVETRHCQTCRPR
jgi:RNA-directed DNA polymerase